MAENSRYMTRRQQSAISALLINPSIPEAAKIAGIAERTLYRWAQLDTFNTEYRTARRALVTRVICVIQGAMSEAVKTLISVMLDGQSTASVKVKAAKVLLESGLKVTEIETLDERISAIESALSQKDENYK